MPEKEKQQNKKTNKLKEKLKKKQEVKELFTEIADKLGHRKFDKKENEWIEYKVDFIKNHPDDIGQYLSALSNSACLFNKPFLWCTKC